MTYIREDNGSTNAQAGSHDDTVMAAAIVLYAMEQFATPTTQIVEPISKTAESDRFVRQSDGQVKHISEIQDERKNEDDGWLSNWG